VDNPVQKYRDRQDFPTEFTDLPRFEALKILFDPARYDSVGSLERREGEWQEERKK
jgi:hypothetical protein